MRTALMFCLLLAGVASAHHSFAQFDSAKPLTLTGVIRNFQWTNPHVYIELEVTANDGNTEVWLLESSSPNQLLRAGWSRNDLKAGVRITADIYQLKSGKRGGWLSTCTLPDGRKLHI